jgi:hypothetical protein
MESIPKAWAQAMITTSSTPISLVKIKNTCEHRIARQLTLGSKVDILFNATRMTERHIERYSIRLRCCEIGMNTVAGRFDRFNASCNHMQHICSAPAFSLSSFETGCD